MGKIVMVNVGRLLQIRLGLCYAPFGIIQFKIGNQRLDEGFAVRQDPDPPPQRRPFGRKAEPRLFQTVDKFIYNQRMAPAAEHFHSRLFQQALFAQINVYGITLGFLPGKQRLLHSLCIPRPARLPQPHKEVVPLVENDYKPEDVQLAPGRHGTNLLDRRIRRQQGYDPVQLVPEPGRPFFPGKGRQYLVPEFFCLSIGLRRIPPLRAVFFRYALILYIRFFLLIIRCIDEKAGRNFSTPEKIRIVYLVPDTLDGRDPVLIHAHNVIHEPCRIAQPHFQPRTVGNGIAKLCLHVGQRRYTLLIHKFRYRVTAQVRKVGPGRQFLQLHSGFTPDFDAKYRSIQKFGKLHIKLQYYGFSRNTRITSSRNTFTAPSSAYRS